MVISPIFNDLSHSQKLACVTFLKLIIKNGEPEASFQRQLYVDAFARSLGVSTSEHERFVINLNIEEFKSDFLKLFKTRVEPVFALVVDLLSGYEKVTERDLIGAEIVFNKVAGIESSQFYDEIEKLLSLSHHVNKISFEPAKKNFLEKTQERMISEASNPDDSILSLSNIAFMVLIALAFLGLLSMCK